MTSQAPTSRGPTDAGLTARVLSSEWQPIETAPKDGTDIIVCHDGYVRSAYWSDEWYGDKTKTGWVPSNTDEEYGYQFQATHWMPLPTPPTNPKGAA